MTVSFRFLAARGCFEMSTFLKAFVLANRSPIRVVRFFCIQNMCKTDNNNKSFCSKNLNITLKHYRVKEVCTPKNKIASGTLYRRLCSLSDCHSV